MNSMLAVANLVVADCSAYQVPPNDRLENAFTVSNSIQTLSALWGPHVTCWAM